MNLRVDTTLVRGGGKQIEQLALRLGTSMSAVETTLQSAAADVGQPAVEHAIDDLVSTLTSAHQRVTAGLDAFAREVQIAATAFDLFTDEKLRAAAKAEHLKRLDGRKYAAMLEKDQPPPLDYRDPPKRKSGE